MTRNINAAAMVCYNPFNHQHRDVVTVKTRKRINALAPKIDAPFVCIYNGDPLLRKDWGRRIEDGDLVAFVVLPQGGGGGGSNPLKIILTIAITAMAPQLGFELASSLGTGIGGFASTSELGGLLGAAISFAGPISINIQMG